MKVKLSKNMKLIAIIVMSLIIITYMFFNSVKEGVSFPGGKKKGGKKSGGGGGGKYQRASWKDTQTCLNELIKKEPKCKYRDKNSDNWVVCDPENDDHKGRIESHKKMLEKWRTNWCNGMDMLNKTKRKWDDDTLDWMRGQHKNYKAEFKRQYSEDGPQYQVESGNAHTQGYAAWASAGGKMYNMSLEFK